MNAKLSPDVVFDVKGANTNYAVYEKIVDARPGLSTEPMLGIKDPTGVAYVGQQRAGINLTAQAYYYYTVEVAAEDLSRGEIARISFDYAW
jgi:hypothetical protein